MFGLGAKGRPYGSVSDSTRPASGLFITLKSLCCFSTSYSDDPDVTDVTVIILLLPASGVLLAAHSLILLVDTVTTTDLPVSDGYCVGLSPTPQDPNTSP